MIEMWRRVQDSWSLHRLERVGMDIYPLEAYYYLCLIQMRKRG